MNFFRFRGVFDNGTDQMAKARKAADPERVDYYLGLLQEAGTDPAAADKLIGALDDDPEVSAADLIAIATAYSRGGTKPTSRAKALAMIRKRHVEIVRTAAKNKIAEKARPW